MKFTKVLLGSAVAITTCFVFSVNVFADEEHSDLYNQVEEVTDGTETSTVDGSEKINTIVDSSGNILAAEVYNEDTDTVITTTSTDSEAIIERTVNGVTTREVFKYSDIPEGSIVSESSFTSSNNYTAKAMAFKPNKGVQVQLMSIYGPWTYTGVAIPKGAVSSLTNMGYSAFAASVGGLFGITTGAANAMLAFMGVGGSVGEIAANGLDTNGNGWIGLYRRTVQEYRNGPINYQFKTN